ncbi:hypothetical protein PMIN05_010281 [Paraphaeosphaeria minitans]
MLGASSFARLMLAAPTQEPTFACRPLSAPRLWDHAGQQYGPLQDASRRLLNNRRARHSRDRDDGLMLSAGALNSPISPQSPCGDAIREPWPWTITPLPPPMVGRYPLLAADTHVHVRNREEKPTFPTLHASRFTLHASRFTLHASRFTLHSRPRPTTILCTRHSAFWGSWGAELPQHAQHRLEEETVTNILLRSVIAPDARNTPSAGSQPEHTRPLANLHALYNRC